MSERSWTHGDAFEPHLRKDDVCGAGDFRRSVGGSSTWRATTPPPGISPAPDLAADPGVTSRDEELLEWIMRNAGRASGGI